MYKLMMADIAAETCRC